MSLKSRIQLFILATVAAVSAILSILFLHGYLTSLLQTASDGANLTARQLKGALLVRLEEQAAKHLPRPTTIAESEAVWVNIIRTDPAITEILQNSMGGTPLLVDALIVGPSGVILSSSRESLKGGHASDLTSLEDWQKKGIFERLWDIMDSRRNYAVTIPVGIQGQPQPIFSIVVAISSVFLREQFRPELQSVGVVFLLSILGSIGVALIVSRVILASLSRLTKQIERISAGNEADIDASSAVREFREVKEFRAVQSKLDLLGRQYHDVREESTQLRSNIESLLHKLEEAVFLFDSSNRLIAAGKHVERWLGCRRNVLIGKHIREIFPVDTAIGLEIQDSFMTGNALADVLVQQVKLGNSSEGLANVSLPGRVLLNVEFLTDSTSSRRVGAVVTLSDAETRSEVSRQLELGERLAAISHLTSGVAHEIKNPLNAIALHVELLKSTYGTDPTMYVIIREIARLDRVVKTFLDFNRPVDLRMQELAVDELIREIATLVSPEAKKRNVTIELQNLEQGHIFADPDLVKQALLNVVANGIDAMQEGGVLSLVTKRWKDGCQVIVQDQGSGIPEHLRDKVFKLYFTTKSNGSGIGLAMSYRLMQLHNGKIDFTSEPGKGTTFRLWFPFAEPKVKSAS